MNSARTIGPVKIIGAGLIGTSIGLALRQLGVEVLISDTSPSAINLSVDFGAGKRFESKDQPALVVVATPPDVAASVIAQELSMHSDAVVLDVASVKHPIFLELQTLGVDLTRYLGTHPMAGREQSGTLSARSDIFVGRPWVITPHPSSTPDSISKAESLALDLGSSVYRLSTDEHDRAVAMVSHVPQIISSLLAARLATAEESDIALAGQGLRDTTRIAASDPKLWIQILSANSNQISEVLKDFEKDLAEIIQALGNVKAAGSISNLGKALERGNQGVSKIPGKHGAKATEYSKVTVMIDDKPGELARLLTEVGEIGVNLEDLMLEHATGAQVGLPELYVLPEREQLLRESLSSRGWKVVG